MFQKSIPEFPDETFQDFLSESNDMDRAFDKWPKTTVKFSFDIARYEFLSFDVNFH